MKFEEIKISLVGVSPLILNNPQSASPLSPFNKEMKTITSKRKKTEIKTLVSVCMEMYRVGHKESESGLRTW